MGKTYRGATRKEFGTKKTKDHKSRSKWTAKNGTRLRSLSADIAEFQAHEDSLGIFLHRPPDHANRGNSLAETIQQLRASKPKPVVTLAPPSPKPTVTQPKKPRQYDLFGELDTSSLEAVKAHAARQAAHLTKIIGQLRKEFSYSDKEACAAMSRYEARRRIWSKVTGTVGPILSARKTSP